MLGVLLAQRLDARAGSDRGPVGIAAGREGAVVGVTGGHDVAAIVIDAVEQGEQLHSLAYELERSVGGFNLEGADDSVTTHELTEGDGR